MKKTNTISPWNILRNMFIILLFLFVLYHAHKEHAIMFFATLITIAITIAITIGVVESLWNTRLYKNAAKLSDLINFEDGRH